MSRPIIGLAPMNGITDHPFRHVQKKYGYPMLVYTEFTSVEGICTGDGRLLKDFLYDESQRPIVAQIYGRTPTYFRQTAVVLCQLGFDGIDINMGCPAKSVAHGGSGAGLIKTPVLAQEIVRAAKMGVRDWQNGATARDCPDLSVSLVEEVEARHGRLPPAFQKRRLVPVSVKTRIGYDSPQVQEWIPRLLDSEPAAIGIHGRTLKQGYSGSADWDEIACAVEIARASDTLILGNGDIQSLDEARQQITVYGVDGVLIGRASCGNPFVFCQGGSQEQQAEPAPARQVDKYSVLHIALEHARLYEESFAHFDRYQFQPMRKHLGWYARDLPAAVHLRRELTQTSSVEEVATVLKRYFSYRQGWEGRLWNV